MKKLTELVKNQDLIVVLTDKQKETIKGGNVETPYM